MPSLKTTPFHERTAALMQGNQWRRWAGHSVASAYELTHDRFVRLPDLAHGAAVDR